jgi:carbonic anhydrase/acetyltransferase-like protein (isoleucine patch superfamily)
VNKAQTLAPYDGAYPKLAEQVFVAPNATLIGSVTVGTGSSIWYGATLRGKMANKEFEIPENHLNNLTNLTNAF